MESATEDGTHGSDFPTRVNASYQGVARGVWLFTAPNHTGPTPDLTGPEMGPFKNPKDGERRLITL